MDRRKKIIWTLVALALAALSIYAVLSQNKELEFDHMVEMIEEANDLWLALGVVCMLGFIFFEGEALLCVLKGIGYERDQKKGLIYSGSDIYFSAITPSATGGQPASAYFMIKDGIPAATVTAVLIVNLIMYTLAILVIGVICLLIKPDIVMHFSVLSKTLIVFGFIALSFLAVMFLLLLRNRRIVYTIGKGLIIFLGKIRVVRNPERRIMRLARTMSDYKNCVDLMQGKYKMLLKVFLFNLIQRASQITVTAMMYLATGGSPSRVVDVWATQSFTVIGSNCIPVPGAMGVSDYLLLDGLHDIVGKSDVVQLELLSRSVSFYICVLICGIITITGYIGLKRKETNNTER